MIKEEATIREEVMIKRETMTMILKAHKSTEIGAFGIMIRILMKAGDFLLLASGKADLLEEDLVQEVRKALVIALRVKLPTTCLVNQIMEDVISATTGNIVKVVDIPVGWVTTTGSNRSVVVMAAVNDLMTPMDGEDLV